jgi:hypothetical protein
VHRSEFFERNAMDELRRGGAVDVRRRTIDPLRLIEDVAD